MSLKGLGKGLEALFDQNEMSVTSGGVKTIAISKIEPNKDQPRKAFAGDALQSLADSIKEHGVISPLLVRPLENGRYQIIAGERRWRASRLAGLSELPVIIMDITDGKTLEIALIENLQRENLNPVEEALGYKALIDEFGLTQEAVAAKIGKSRPAVANSLRLLNLPPKVLEMVRSGDIEAGHAKAVLSCKTDADRIKLAELIVSSGCSVRKAEDLAKKIGEVAPAPAKQTVLVDYIANFEKSLSAQLSRKVRLVQKGGKGKLEIEYYDNSDLDALLNTLGLYTEE